MHTVSSFFPVYPTGASLSRSAVCEQSGANTQVGKFNTFTEVFAKFLTNHIFALMKL